MRRLLLIPTIALLAAAEPPPEPVTPTGIVQAAPASAWKTIKADDLLVIQLQSGQRVLIQLAPDFAPVHVANIRALARAHWWDKAAVYRVQDNYVVQWGKNEGEEPLPAGVVAKPPAGTVKTRPASTCSVAPGSVAAAL